VNPENRSELFRESVAVMRKAWKEHFPTIDSLRVHLANGDLLPKPKLSDIPLMVTGHSGQSPEWIAEHSDGWIYYPRGLKFQKALIDHWRSLTEEFKPFTQSLYIDLAEDPNHVPIPIHLGFRTGRNFVIEFLAALQDAGVNHVIINLKYGQRPVEEVIEELGEFVLPHFPALS
jgi:luciferase-type oxidoreductase